MTIEQASYKFCDRHCRMPCDGKGNIYWYKRHETKPRKQPCPLLQQKIKDEKIEIWQPFSPEWADSAQKRETGERKTTKGASE